MKTVAFVKMAILLVLCLSLFQESNGQCPAKCPKGAKKSKRFEFRQFKQYQVDAKFGVGILPTFFMDGGKVYIPPLSAYFDVFLHPNFFVGISGGLTEQEVERNYKQANIRLIWKNKFYHTGLRMAAAYTGRDDWNMYGGFMVGLNFSNLTTKKEPELGATTFQEFKDFIGFKPKRTHLAFSGLLGFQYAPNPKISIWGELGQSVSLLTVGLGYRIN